GGYPEGVWRAPAAFRHWSRRGAAAALCALIAAHGLTLLLRPRAPGAAADLVPASHAAILSQAKPLRRRSMPSLAARKEGYRVPEPESRSSNSVTVRGQSS